MELPGKIVAKQEVFKQFTPLLGKFSKLNFPNLSISLDKSSKSPAKEDAGRLFTSEVRQRKSDYKINNLMINFVAQTGSETRNLSSSLNSQP